MQITESNVIAQLERLAEGCPWDGVDLWICREPEGNYGFTAYIRDNPKFGFHSIFGHGITPQGAVDDALRQAKGRDPEIARVKKIEELKRQIEQLQAVVIGMPPYRPNRELCAVNAPATVDV